MSDAERDEVIRRCAAGGITWHAMREMGFDSHLDVLGRLGLRPPIAPTDGANVASRERPRALVGEALMTIANPERSAGAEDAGTRLACAMLSCQDS